MVKRAVYDVSFIVITGLSGAGKSEAARSFEDMGYFCIDNLPPSLISRMAELCAMPGSAVKKVALVSDIRGGHFFEDLQAALANLKERKIDYRVLFLQASDEALLKRFKETRRPHPLAEGGRVIEGIKSERRLLSTLKGDADMVIDTSNLSAHDLREKIRTTFLGVEKQRDMVVTVTSFGYKYGMPIDADIIMDVRFLPNPHYIEELRYFHGGEEPVKNFVLSQKITGEFISKFFDLLDFLLGNYKKEGKTYLNLALGCTGGTHRSVTLAESTAEFLREKGYPIIIRHRDVGKDFKRL
ncbi:MAG: RNase adapter RapZ [Actinomycetia bacterium]|nr:RNase adapter RapZ [Actinomycetes bacterium]